MDRKNINRGFKKLRVWQDAIALYVLAYKIFSKFPFKLKKVAGNPAVAGLFIAFIEKSQKAIVISGTYKNIHGEIVTIDPKSLDSNAEVMRF